MCSEASGGAAAVAPDVVESLVSALQQAVLAFCAACYALGGAAAGATLRKDVRKLAAGVVEPCVDLLKAVVSAEAAAAHRSSSACCCEGLRPSCAHQPRCQAAAWDLKHAPGFAVAMSP